MKRKRGEPAPLPPTICAHRNGDHLDPRQARVWVCDECGGTRGVAVIEEQKFHDHGYFGDGCKVGIVTLLAGDVHAENERLYKVRDDLTSALRGTIVELAAVRELLGRGLCDGQRYWCAAAGCDGEADNEDTPWCETHRKQIRSMEEGE